MQPQIGETINHNPWTAVKTLLEAFINPPHSLCSHMAVFTDALWDDIHIQRIVRQDEYTGPINFKATHQILYSPLEESIKRKCCTT